MTRIIIAVFLTVFIAGCSTNNEMTIQNIAGGSVYVNFRAKTYQIVPNNSVTIDDIPNGTYDYTTTYQIPAGYTGGGGEAASGTFTFLDRMTKVNVIYSSTIDDTTYILGCSISSTINQALKSTTSTE